MSVWDSIENAVETIKNVIAGFFDIVKAIFGFVPAPFSDVLGIMTVIIIAITAVKVVRG